MLMGLDHFALLQERRDIVDMMSVSLAADAQAAADEVDEAAIDETVDQIMHDESESDDSSTTSDVVTISSDDDAEAADDVDVSGSIQTASMRPLPDGDWLDKETLMSLLKDPPADICHSRAPDGDKSDSYFLLSNDDNVQRRKAGRARTFYDDCGAWDKKGGRISVYPYVTDSHGSMRRLFLIKKQYCFEQKQNGRRIYDPLEPQPTSESVSTLTRY